MSVCQCSRPIDCLFLLQVIAPLIMDYMLSAGAQIRPDGALLFPVGSSKLTEEEIRDKQWMPVEIVPVEQEHSASPGPPEAATPVTHFNTSEYFRHLRTEALGQSVLYARQMHSTQDIVDRCVQPVSCMSG